MTNATMPDKLSIATPGGATVDLVRVDAEQLYKNQDVPTTLGHAMIGYAVGKLAVDSECHADPDAAADVYDGCAFQSGSLYLNSFDGYPCADDSGHVYIVDTVDLVDSGKPRPVLCIADPSIDRLAYYA